MRLTFVLLISIFFSFSMIAQHIESNHLCKRASESLVINDISFKTSSFTENYDLKYYRFEWYINPSIRYIKGVATPYFEVLEDGFNQISFDMAQTLNIDSITWHGQKLNYSQPEAFRLDVFLPQELQKGSLDSISIAYQGEPFESGFGSFIQTIHGDNVPVLWTLSEPFGSQDWWPCKNGNDDKIDSMDVFITTELGFKAACNGVLVDEFSPEEGLITYHWKHNYPISPYLLGIAVTNYEVYQHDVHLSDGSVMPMVNYVYPESLSSAQAGTARNVQALEFFDSLFVDYPFKNEKYGHAQFSWGGGMEHQTMTFVVNFGWDLLNHELGHQWFGNLVTCETWTDVWLNEGFASYLAGLCHERFPSSSNDWYNWKNNTINNATIPTSGSVKVDDVSNVNRIFNSRLSYDKASIVVHMLRWKLGDEDFFQGLRNYLNKYAYGTVTTDNLKTELEAVSGQDLTSFFENWYEGEGYPIYHLTWNQENDKVIVKVNQTPVHNSVEFFDMPIEFRFAGINNSVSYVVDNTENDQIFEFDVNFEVKALVFDPNLWLLTRNTTIEKDTSLTATTATNDLNAQFYVSPNPTDKILTLHDNYRYNSTYDIISSKGTVIKSGKTTGYQTDIDVSEFQPGIYYLRVNDGKKGAVIKWIKI